ncbi:hypothetical protein Kpho02_74090 [Kitasatospora phosalacinea]|uniref:Uncharacterized protein n=1 Tax=Kitasatospora phosalacinea TaxID=2065 RepID=A0A9W6QE56_9ACTN|nr:hypothetical protein [Kitasatospora phosalacinea]GLW75112.1 hypothetical protein Kpho02_74090 [Kitasatospora phosalacinea]
MAVAALVFPAACTAGSPADGRPPAPTGPWALLSVQPAVVEPELQAELDAPTAAAPVRVLGVAEVAGGRLVAAVRGDTCFAAAVPAGAGTGFSSYGASRPGGADGAAQGRVAFPGTLLPGPYAQAAGPAGPPFRYLALGCSEHAMAVRAEGVAPGSAVALTGGAARAWVEGSDLYLTVGLPRG